MLSDRTRRHIERLLDEADKAIERRDWTATLAHAQDVLAFDPENADGKAILAAAERALGAQEASLLPPAVVRPPSPTAPPPAQVTPSSFAGGRYQVKRFLGEGGKKKVYLAHDTLLDRDVAFAIIKTEGLDEAARARITREAQAMGRLGSHPNIVTVFDLGDHEGQPFMVTELMQGGDVEGLIEKAEGHRLPLERAIEIAISVCRGLEFSHGKGIVHRDLKPGNVWLTADGTAKIGDFGLVLLLEGLIDRTRLTQAGMMVGTVSYMPPEQALGGEVTPKSDLYSLGAMLYEMATGRPPFVGDDSIAIIGQHLNTPPVSPSWHRADIPPSLEALILQLLEKDPSQRPESASRVLQALASVGKETPEEGVQTLASGPTSNPIYRRVFVGGEAELRQLQTAFDGAISGRGSLAVVVGEPGIGKTAFCEQLSTYVALRGGKTLVGHCYEEGSLSLPYLAFVEALRTYVLSREPDELRKELGSGAGDVARIVSEVRERLQVEARPAGNPEEERYRLLQAVSDFLRNAATVQPLLVILEDLHDADKGTLEMLTHVARSLSGSRVLIVGTYRDVEVDRSHPLSGALAELRRVTSFLRVPLRGLTAEEVQRMLGDMSGQAISWGLAEAVHRQTEGNPLFVQEVLRYLAEEGLITREGGRWRESGPGSLATVIPEGLRDVIGKRLSRLSSECNRILSTAAVIGRDFSLRVLERVAGVSEEALIGALEEATGAAILEEKSTAGSGSSFRFSHAFFRQTLYEEIFAPRRIRIHQQVGRALEEVYGRRVEEHAAEMAEHFSQSTEPVDLAKAVSYGEMAAKRALTVYAYGEAMRLLAQAIQAQEVLDPDDKARSCDLLLALGEARSLGGEPRRYLDDEAQLALSLAESLGDRKRAYRACEVALDAVNFESGGEARGTAEAMYWAEEADRYAESGTVERARSDAALGGVRCGVGRFEEGRRLIERGLELARRLGDPDTLARVEFRWLQFGSSHQWEERLHLVEEIGRRYRSGAVSLKPGTYTGSLWFWSARTFLEAGEREQAEEAMREHRGLAERTRQPAEVIRSMHFDAIVSALDGRLEEAVETGRRMLTRGEDLGIVEWARFYASQNVLRPLLYLGRAEEALALRPSDGSVWDSRERAICLAHLERPAEVGKILSAFVPARSGSSSSEEETNPRTDTNLLEAAVIVRNKEAVRLLLLRFVRGSPPTTGVIGTTCVSRHLGAAEALLGRPNEARAHYESALEVAQKMRFRPEIALIRLQLAELLLEHYPDERAEAMQHLDFAIGEFREMKMQPSLERALRHREILKA
jgi:serine/threonine protein kinase/tetratricopeptide (TPR) repeat protein